MSYKYLVFDMNNLFWIAFMNIVTDENKHKLVTDGIEIYPKVIIEALSILNNTIKRYTKGKEYKAYLLYDNPETEINIRKLISDGEYKSARERKGINKSLYATLDLLIEVTARYNNNWHILQSKSLEADDLTYPVLKLCDINKYNKALLISNDKDWARNINENIHWSNWETVYTKSLYEQKYGYSPVGKKVQFDKCIRGDKADTIKPALPYLPKNLHIHILNTYEDVHDLIKNCGKDSKLVNWKNKIWENKKYLTTNYILTDFMPVTRGLEADMIHGECNPKWLDLFYSAVNLPKEEWFNNFNQKQKEKGKGNIWAKPYMP